MDGQVDGQTDEQTDGWTDGRMDERTDGWTDGVREVIYERTLSLQIKAMIGARYTRSVTLQLHQLFLVATKSLYVSRSVGPSVRRSVGPSVRR